MFFALFSFVSEAASVASPTSLLPAEPSGGVALEGSELVMYSMQIGE